MVKIHSIFFIVLEKKQENDNIKFELFVSCYLFDRAGKIYNKRDNWIIWQVNDENTTLHRLNTNWIYVFTKISEGKPTGDERINLFVRLQGIDEKDGVEKEACYRFGHY